MIKKIKSINNFAVFENFNWNNSVKTPDGAVMEFTKLNILYGRNYSGKTTLSRIVTDENYDMLFSFGNNARKFLEMYLYFKYPIPRREESEYLKKFFAPEEVPPILINRIVNEGSHGVSPERMMKIDIEPETINVAKKIIEKLQQDSDQYNALLKSIGETS